jgi:hypothetical protein
MTRVELLKHSSFTSGGGLTRLLEELTQSGFITGFTPFQGGGSALLYKLTDEYSRFYLKFVAGNPGSPDAWNKQANSPAWRSWSGTAFEDICLKHTLQIKQALGISGIHTSERAWQHAPAKGERGAQIDLLIDRQDFCINICEMKFSTEKFTLTKKYVEDLQYKLSVFREVTQTRKTLFVTFITTFGLTDNAYRLNFVQQQVTMDALFA